MSFELVLNPMLNLIEDSASLKDLPKASKTWDGSPLLHADPLEQIILDFKSLWNFAPFKSNTVKFKLWGNLFSMEPLINKPELFYNNPSKRLFL